MTIFIFILLSIMVAFNTTTAQWSRQQVPGDVGFLLSVDFVDDSNGVSGGWQPFVWGRAIYTEDGGTTWQRSRIPDSTRALVTLIMRNKQLGYAAGAYNLDTNARHSRTSLLHQRSAPFSLPNSVMRHFESIGFKASDQYRGSFLRTTNGGRDWLEFGSLPDSISYLIGASFCSDSVGYVSGTTSQEPGGKHMILKTVDGGMHWRSLPTPDSLFALNGVVAISQQHVIGAGFGVAQGVAGGAIIRTTDGGDSWDRLSVPGIEAFQDVHFVSPQVGYVVGFGFGTRSVIYKTSNGGETWQLLNFAYDFFYPEGISFSPNGHVGMVYGWLPQRIGFARTTDAGTTWRFQQIGLDSAMSILLGGDVVSDTVAYVCGSSSSMQGLMFYTCTGGVTSTRSISETPQRFSLRQNYPNPFNPTTTFTFDVGMQAHVSLRLYDVLGREVTTIVNEELSAGVHERTFDASAFSSGVYFYQMKAGSFLQTRQLVIAK